MNNNVLIIYYYLFVPHEDSRLCNGLPRPVVVAKFEANVNRFQAASLYLHVETVAIKFVLFTMVLQYFIFSGSYLLYPMAYQLAL